MDQLTVGNIIMSPDFAEAFNSIRDEIRSERIKAGAVQFKRGPLERMQERCEFNKDTFPKLYLNALDGSLNSTEYPSAVRAFIKLIGDEAYRRTVAKITKRDQQEQKPQM